MHDIDSVKKRIITSMIAILLLIFALFGITYAYFTAKVKGNTNDKSVDVSAGKLELTYGDGNGFIKVDKIQPGEVIKSKTFTVKNTGTGDIDSYEVILENIVNELKYYNDLTYELDCKSDNGTCNGSSNTFPIYDGSIVTNSIKVNETHTYTLTLTYHETNLDQSDDMDKNIEAKVNIRDSEYNYNKLNIYGNAEGLGTLVNNDTDRFNGMYKVDVKSVGKNLFDLSKIKIINKSDVNNLEILNNSFSFLSKHQHYASLVRLNNLYLKKGIYKISGSWNSDNGKKAGWGIVSSSTPEGSDLLYNYAANGFFQTFEIENSDYYRISFYSDYSAPANTKTSFINIQIEKGDKATEYEPYNEKIYSVYIKEPLRCLDTICDYVDLVSKKVVRKIKDDNGTLSLLDNVVEEKIQSIDTDILTDRNIVVDNSTNVETELDR